MTDLDKKSDSPPSDSTALRERVFFSARDGMSLTLHALLYEKNQKEIDDLLNNDICYQGTKCTPLIVAARNGREGSVRILLEKFKPPVKLESEGTVKFDEYVIEGFNRHHYGITGATALWCAAGAGHLSIVKRLVRAGANVDHATKTLSTPLRAACFDGRLDIVKYLVRHGADIHKSNKYNNTCLMISAYKGHLDVLQFLLDSGARVDDRALCGATALHFAAECGHAAVVETLLYHGAKMLKNNNGMTPLHCAAERAREKVVDIFASRPEVSRLDAVQSYELLGASFANDKEYYCLRKAFLYLQTAMKMRNDPLLNLPPKEPLPPVPAYDNWRESVTEEDVERLLGNAHALHMEGLTIRERLLGRSCPDLPHPVVFRGAVFADEAKFDKCLALWRHALMLRQENNVALAKDLLRFAQVFSQMIHTDVQLPLEQVGFVLEACVEEISRCNLKLQSPPDNSDVETLYEEFENNVRTALYLVSVASRLLEEDKHEMEVEMSVKKSVFNMRNIRLKSGHTLLHMAVDRQTPVDDFHTSDICEFPCPRTASLLIKCGCNVNAIDVCRRTPLLVALLSFQIYTTQTSQPIEVRDVFGALVYRNEPPVEERQRLTEAVYGVVVELINEGAHLDAMDMDGVTPLVAAMGTSMEPLVRTAIKPELRCLAATVMVAHRLKYNKIQVPKDMHAFLELHGVFLDN